MITRNPKLPTISAVVATYNRADYLRISLACLAAQDYAGAWQIIVADDGSTDHTPDVISKARSDYRELDKLKQKLMNIEHRTLNIEHRMWKGCAMAILIAHNADCRSK